MLEVFLMLRRLQPDGATLDKLRGIIELNMVGLTG